MTFSWRLVSKRTRGKSNHKFRALAENEETENFDGNEAVPNPEPQEILNAEADADPGNNLTIASCSFPKIPEAEPLLQQDANPGKIYYYRKILKANKTLALCLKLMKKINNNIWLRFFESLPQNRWCQSHYYLFC